MRWNRQRIKELPAFTVNEMLVVLLLTTIVVGMAFAVLQLVQQQMHGIDRNYEQSTELNLLRQSLWVDFNQSDGIWYDDQANTLLFTNEINEVTYQLLEDRIVKDRDTFQIALKGQAFFFRGITKAQGEIDALDFSTEKRHGAQRLFVFKKNAATSYLNE